MDDNPCQAIFDKPTRSIRLACQICEDTPRGYRSYLTVTEACDLLKQLGEAITQAIEFAAKSDSSTGQIEESPHV
jgi:hypothetical protein